jgi:Calcium-activated chloride channel
MSGAVFSAIGGIFSSRSLSADKDPLEAIIRKEISLDTANIDDEFLEIIIQFGFVSMFSVVCPLCPGQICPKLSHVNPVLSQLYLNLT